MVMNILRSRKFAKRVMFVLLILIIPAFVLWGAGNITRGPEFIGRINEKNIYPKDLAKSLQGIRTQLIFTYYGDYNTLNQILRNRSLMNFMAWERLILLSSAQESGNRIADKDVLSFVGQHPIFQRQGTFDREVYNYVLRNSLSIDARQFEELVRENMQVQLLRQEILADVSVSDEELLEAYKKVNDIVDLSYFTIDKGMFSEEVTVTSEDAKKYFDNNEELFFKPPKVQVEYIEFPYENAAERDKVIRQIEKLYPQLIEFPGKFSETAENAGLRHTETAPFTREDVVPGVAFFKGFQDMAFSIKQGEISRPLFSSEEEAGSAYILRKTNEIPPAPLTFEEVREDLILGLTDRELISLSEEKAGEFYTQIIETDMTYDEAAKALRQQIKTTGPITARDYIENIGPAERVVFLARETSVGEVTPPITFKGGVLLVRVEGIAPADETDFEEQKENARKNFLLRKQMAAMDKWFKENSDNSELTVNLNEL
ncbi:MAG: SurA N-terminal domain-containing protein [Candidatus Omnitrophica bacterium]|nr:SurA N-terminal domain-containing protein [Candidatus Omnitrophota bacterium]